MSHQPVRKDTGHKDLGALLWPGSIALVGVSPEVDTIRGRMLESVLHCEFDGPLYLVSRSHASIGDLPCYKSVDALPGPVDLAVLTIPANFVNETMQACADKRVRAVVIISSGFAEEPGGEGLTRQQQLRRIADEHDMVLIGPNAEGFLNSFMPLIATFSPVLRKFAEPLLPTDVKADAIAVTSQSGGIGFAFFDRGRPRQLPFGYLVSMGNEAGEESLQMMDHMLDDARIGVGLMFLEGFKTPASFEAVAAKAMAAGKPLVIAKMGRSAEGAAAAAAHTSSMAGEFASYEAMMAHMGVASSDDLDDTLDIAAAFAFYRRRLPRGPRVAVLTPSGGAGIWLTDACVGAGLQVPELDAPTRKEFDELLPSYGSSRNPVDLTAQFIINRSYAQGIEMALRSHNIDMVLVASSLGRVSSVEHDYERLVAVAAASGKPVMFWSYTRPHRDCVALLARAGIPCFTSVTGIARAARALVDYQLARTRVLARTALTAPSASTMNIKQSLPFKPDRNTLCEYELAPLLDSYGVHTSGALANDEQAAVDLARGISAPVALKVQSAQILHKSDAGVLRLGLDDEAGVRDAYRAIIHNAHQHLNTEAGVDTHAIDPATDDPIDDVLDGVLVQAMAAPGVEMILGVNRDPGFGLMMLVGAGGVLVELMNDSVLAPLPATADDAHHMLDQLASRRLLDGLRGAPPADVDALVALMLRIADFARDHAAQIGALDLNPVIVHARGQGVSVVDALLLGPTETG